MALIVSSFSLSLFLLLFVRYLLVAPWIVRAAVSCSFRLRSLLLPPDVWPLDDVDPFVLSALSLDGLSVDLSRRRRLRASWCRRLRGRSSSSDSSEPDERLE